MNKLGKYLLLTKDERLISKSFTNQYDKLLTNAKNGQKAIFKWLTDSGKMLAPCKEYRTKSHLVKQRE